MNEKNLFDEIGGVEKSWEKHWKEMPEYIQEDLQPYKSIKINFRNEEDYKDFAKLIGQKLTYKTLSVWYPVYDREKPSNFLYISDES